MPRSHGRQRTHPTPPQPEFHLPVPKVLCLLYSDWPSTLPTLLQSLLGEWGGPHAV
ncbi:hypothetical protein I79_012671 [Cricetulus griseus]|uniref:Uncharacterized protein n=1 Tax=Cricetulus griseus TaxID=10029 RepID=G3HPF9_CRIGR|nr:hypothetical protein I79_012671 [Cricetulus griseus]